MTASPSKFKMLTMTDAAAKRAKAIMSGKDGIVGLRLGVKNGGCAGMEYTMDWASEITKGDEIVEDQGVTILIEPKAVLFLLGTEMDYQVDKLSAKFVFNNPNQSSACGCGESVTLTEADPAALSAFKGDA